MYGGADNDTYIVGEEGDLVIELEGEGVDTVRSFLANYTLPDHVERLDLSQTNGVNGTGNALDNGLRGNALNNALYGLAGNDSLHGGAGDDLIVGGSGAIDYLFGGTGADRFEFSAADSSAANAVDNINDLSFEEGDTIALFGLGAGGGDVVLASYKDVYDFVRATPGVLAATNGNGSLLLTTPNGPTTQIINIIDSQAWAKFQAQNPNPVANNDAVSTDENSSIKVNVLTNDTDDTPLKLKSASIGAGQGSVKLDNGQVRFDPGTDFDYLMPGQSAEVLITYVIEDKFGKTATAILKVTVTGSNEAALIGGNDLGSVIEEKDLSVAGKLTIDDPDGPDLFSAGVYAGKFGSLSLLEDGTWTYNLNPFDKDLNSLNSGQSEIDTITIMAADGTTHQIKVTVNGANERPARPDECTHTNDPNNHDSFNSGGQGGTLTSSQLGSANILVGFAGGEVINGKARADTIYGLAGNDRIDGGQGDDLVYGGSGNDVIDGGQGDDRLFGGSGRDRIDGGQGNDLIYGGFGADILTGGQGADRFVFLDECDTNDVITDFGKGSDKIDLSDFKVNGADFDFTGPVKAQTFEAGRNLIWFHENGKTIILGNTDDDPNTAELMITLDGVIDLSGSDFLL
jgi:VCBS repeat-containing protein